MVTDHKALQYLHKMKNANGRLTRWALAVQPFSFDIVHAPGNTNGHADGLSRQAWPDKEGSHEHDTEKHCFTAEVEEGSVGI